MRRIYTIDADKTTSRTRGYLKVSVVFLLAIFALEVWMVNRLSTYGEKLNQIKLAESKLQLENQLLENKIAQKSSLLQTTKNSGQLGFSEIKNVEYIKPLNMASAK